MVRRGLEESCARLAGKGWPQLARTAKRVREALRGLGGSVEVESYRGTAIERRWHVGQRGKRRYFSSLPSATSMSACPPAARSIARFAICRVPAQCSTWRAGSSVVRFLAPPSSDPSPVLALTLPFAKSALRFYPLEHKNLIASCQRRPALASL